MATTNPSASDAATQKKYENSETVAATRSTQTEEAPSSLTPFTKLLNSFGRAIGIPFGAIPRKPAPAEPQIQSVVRTLPITDMRAKIRVPSNYLTQLTRGPDDTLAKLGGIVFPYTPQLSFEHKADYSSQTPIHSNFSINFYQRSSIAPITISGKFTVSNEPEAMVFIATVHLLRALTKMRFGNEVDAGAPPPICRLDAFGAFMIQNVPVAITSFKIDFSDSIDYFTVGKTQGSQAFPLYGMTSVPVVSTISVTCLPMYSRDEMQKFTVTSFLNDKNIKKAGYL